MRFCHTAVSSVLTSESIVDSDMNDGYLCLNRLKDKTVRSRGGFLVRSDPKAATVDKYHDR